MWKSGGTLAADTVGVYLGQLYSEQGEPTEGS